MSHPASTVVVVLCLCAWVLSFPWAIFMARTSVSVEPLGTLLHTGVNTNRVTHAPYNQVTLLVCSFGGHFWAVRSSAWTEVQASFWIPFLGSSQLTE